MSLLVTTKAPPRCLPILCMAQAHANYKLLFISIQDEIAWPTGKGWLPFSADQIWAYEGY